MKEKLLIIGAVLISVLILFGAYTLIERSKLREEQKREADKQYQEEVKRQQEESYNQSMYWACETDAWNNYIADWNANCKMLKRKKGCALPLYLSDRLEDTYDKKIDRCVTLYK